MEKISRRKFMQISATAGALAAVSGAALPASACFTKTAPENGTAQTIVIHGFAFGPGVTATIVELSAPVMPHSMTGDDFVVTEHKEAFDWATFAADHIVSTTVRKVNLVSTCTAEGRVIELPSRYVRLELECDPDVGGPFCYDLYTGKNTWCDPYQLEVRLADGAAVKSVTGKPVTLHVDPEVSFAEAKIPEMDAFDLSGTFTGSDGKTLTYASYKPSVLHGGKLPLVIWLHGAGEGGTDPSLALLGNEVTPLAEDAFQKAMGGAAYILTPQTKTFWLEWNESDPSSWGSNPGKPSVYTKVLKELIDDFVAKNPRIDPNRIIIGGCSNGGYMTMNMVMQYPDYFAAAYPICEAYRDAGITDAQLAAIKHLPIWFIYAENDTVVLPDDFEKPTIARLKAIGADVHTSIFADVHDTTGLYKGADGKPYQYQGHWSWTYFFRNECTDDVTGENMWDWMSRQSC